LLEDAGATSVESVVDDAAGAIPKGIGAVAMSGEGDTGIADIGEKWQAVHSDRNAAQSGRVQSVGFGTRCAHSLSCIELCAERRVKRTHSIELVCALLAANCGRSFRGWSCGGA